MKLTGLKTVNQLQNIEKQKPIFNLKSMKPLSNAEEKLILDQFPTQKSNQLELYLSTGRSKTEKPDSIGRNLDFRI